MNLVKFVPESILKVAGRPMLQVQKHSPIILFVCGSTAALGATVLACRATLKVESVLADAETSKKMIEAGIQLRQENYTEKDASQDLMKLKVRTAYNLTKLYAPAAGVGFLALGMLTGSHYIMSSRQAALMAAYATLDKSYREYQQRVGDELGVEREEQIRHGATLAKTKDAEGKSVKTYHSNGLSVYARLFSQDTSDEWVETPDYNVVVLRTKQTYLNHKLQAQGHVFLNDVYKELGLQPTSAGQMVGWLKDGAGDCYIDFGIFKNDEPRVRDFVMDGENAVWLDFNVDGVIYDKI